MQKSMKNVHINRAILLNKDVPERFILSSKHKCFK